MTTSNPEIVNITPDLDSELENAEAAIALAREQVAQLEVAVRMARGTRDKITAPRALPEKILEVLASRIATTSELSSVLSEPIVSVTPRLEELREAGRVHNVGTANLPRWSAVLGDDAPAEQLYPLVERLITCQPMTTAELVAATGARASRVSGAIIQLQRTRPVLNLGRANAARWFLVPEAARPAHLEAKRRRR